VSFRDFSLLVLICLIWGFNMIAAKVAVADLNVPPLFFSALRSGAIALAVVPWLFPMPRPYWRTVAVGVLMGGGSFALLFVGLKTATPSAAAIVSQLGVPLVTILSVVMLGERVRWRRGLGIALTLAGALVVMWEPAGFTISSGLIFVTASALGGALGTVLLKQMEGIRPLRLQAWVGFSSVVLLAALTTTFESGQVKSAIGGGWLLLLIVLYSSLIVSVFAHTKYYGLIHRYDATQIAPLTLMSPLFSIGFGIWLTGDHFDFRMLIGAVLALAGVFIIAVRPNRALGPEVLMRERV
jgi:drug/metabolite transporter (DMT)-like permease